MVCINFYVRLATALTECYPGIIVAPVPARRKLGRFEQSFIESRMIALQRMIEKICSHSILKYELLLTLHLETC